MDCFSEIGDAQRLYCDWGGESPVRTQLQCTHFRVATLTVDRTHMYARTCTERTTLLYLWLISDPGYTNIINQAD